MIICSDVHDHVTAARSWPLMIMTLWRLFDHNSMIINMDDRAGPSFRSCPR